ncbi:MAG: type VI secretion system protein TssA [Rhodobacteraceae bacterium]|nr:type VI secretion system protein TssA [Paracoccaceae bacterium]
MTELQAFLDPVDGPNISGTELRNDLRFHALERELEVASRESRAEAAKNGTTVQIDWSSILDQCAALAASGRDLRLLVIVVRALAGTNGLAGLAEGLGLLRETVVRFWDSVHPELRPAPTKGEAAMRRINAIRQIENADNGLLCDLSYGVLMSARMFGQATGSDLSRASIGWATAEAEGPSGLGEKERAAAQEAYNQMVARVTGICRATAAERPEDYAAVLDGAGAALHALASLEAALDAQVAENGVGVKFDRLAKFLTRIEATLKAHRPAEAGAPAAAAEAAPAAPAAAPPEASMNGTAQAAPPAAPAAAFAAAAAPAAPAAFPPRITSRDEVIRCLDLIIDFYERTEPSSPIPHLAQRMRKMVPMNFMQLMEEIAPSGMKEFRSIAGVLDDKK